MQTRPGDQQKRQRQRQPRKLHQHQIHQAAAGRCQEGQRQAGPRGHHPQPADHQGRKDSLGAGPNVSQGKRRHPQPQQGHQAGGIAGHGKRRQRGRGIKQDTKHQQTTERIGHQIHPSQGRQVSIAPQRQGQDGQLGSNGRRPEQRLAQRQSGPRGQHKRQAQGGAQARFQPGAQRPANDPRKQQQQQQTRVPGKAGGQQMPREQGIDQHQRHGNGGKWQQSVGQRGSRGSHQGQQARTGLDQRGQHQYQGCVPARKQQQRSVGRQQALHPRRTSRA